MGPLEEKTLTQPCCVDGKRPKSEAIDLLKIDKGTQWVPDYK